jgi:hypothetical protein
MEAAEVLAAVAVLSVLLQRKREALETYLLEVHPKEMLVVQEQFFLQVCMVVVAVDQAQ